MRKIFCASFALLLMVASITANTQNTNNSNGTNTNATRANTNNSNRRRGPVFRATRDQIKQAQAILTQRGFYTGEQTGTLTPETRAGLRRYQQAENLRVTGTLNRVTLEKMNITLTERQRAIQ